MVRLYVPSRGKWVKSKDARVKVNARECDVTMQSKCGYRNAKYSSAPSMFVKVIKSRGIQIHYDKCKKAR